eukprot:5642545-Prymnesium_polylepis.1
MHQFHIRPVRSPDRTVGLVCRIATCCPAVAVQYNRTVSRDATHERRIAAAYPVLSSTPRALALLHILTNPISEQPQNRSGPIRLSLHRFRGH